MPMPDNPIWPVIVLAALASFVGVGIATRLARRAQMLDEPGQRASHTRPTPTGGGAGLFAAVVLVSLMPQARELLPAAWLLAFLPGVFVLSLMGWLDDRTPLSPWLRLFVQFAVSIGLLTFLAQSEELRGILSPGPWLWLLMAISAVLLVWIMNAYNFMDGSDAMAGGQGLFSAAALGYLLQSGGQTGFALAAWILAAACLGFLPWNFPRARVFMGDAGSVPLGFALAGLALVGCLSGAFPWAVGALVLSVFLVDASMTLVLRILRRERWYTPHKRHVYQRLIQMGWSHGQVLALYQGFNVLVVLPGMVMCAMFVESAWLIAVPILLVMIFGWCIALLKWGVDT